MTTLTMIPCIFGLRGAEWIVILILVLLLFGGKKIPQLMRGLGKGMGEFKKGVNEAKEELDKATRDEPGTAGDKPKPTAKD